MSKARERLEATLGRPEAFRFLDLVPPEAAETIAARTETRLEEAQRAIDTAAEEALPRLPGWLRRPVRGLMGPRS